MHAEVANQRSRKRTRFDQLVEQADGPVTVDEDAAKAMKYLTSYSSGTVMTDDRIVSVSETEVVFTYKAYRENARVKESTVDPLEFIRRFLQHVLPQRMRHIRHYGFYSHVQQTPKLTLIRSQLIRQRTTTSICDASAEEVEEPEEQEATDSPSDSGCRCPKCNGKMIARNVVDRPTVQDILDMPIEVINGATSVPPLKQREIAFGFP